MKILSFLFCEDVRKEADGKSTIIGVFDGLQIGANSFNAGPAAIRLATHMRFQLDVGEPIPDKSTLTIRFNDAEIVTGMNEIKINRIDLPVSLIAPMSFIPITGAGVISYEYTFWAKEIQLGAPHRFGVSVQIMGAPDPQATTLAG